MIHKLHKEFLRDYEDYNDNEKRLYIRRLRYAVLQCDFNDHIVVYKINLLQFWLRTRLRKPLLPEHL